MTTILLIYMIFTGVYLKIANSVLNIIPGTTKSYIATILLLLIQSIFAIFVYKKNKSECEKDGKYTIFMLIFIPLTILFVFSFVNQFNISITFVYPIIIAFLASLNEEVLFRLTIFNNLKKQKSIFNSILISAIIFSLVHIVNIFGTTPINQVMLQLVNTFFAGVFFACVYQYTKNIYLMIAYHFMWDYIPLSQIMQKYPNIIVAIISFMVLELLISIVLLNKYKKNTQV